MNPHTFRILTRFLTQVEGELRDGLAIILRDRGLELSARELAILRYLGERRAQDVTVGDVQGYLDESASAVSQAITRMMDDHGLVSKARGRRDQRQTFVQLTQAGLELAVSMKRFETDLLAEHCSRLAPTKRIRAAFDEGAASLDDLITSMFAHGVAEIAARKLRDASDGEGRGNIARVYDYFLGGSQYTLADEQIAASLMADAPGGPAAAAENRALLQRASRYLATEGIEQFLDIGSGLPTMENTHEIVQRIRKTARVVYVDKDPSVVDLANRYLCERDTVRAVQGSLEDPRGILDAAQAAGIDFDKPVGLLLVAVLHFLVDDGQAYDAVATLRQKLAPDSAVVITHGCRPDDEEHARRMEASYGRAVDRIRLRTFEQVRRFFEATRIVDPPGLVFAPRWTVAGAESDREQDFLLRFRPPLFEQQPEKTLILAGVGRIDR